MSTTYGYIRVSTKEQNEDRQLLALKKFGISNSHIYCDKKSGKDFDRPAYRRLLRKLKPGDTLAVKSIDRLGRNYKEIIEQWRTITKDKGAAIVVLDMPILDTREGKDLIGTVISDIVLQLLSYVAETERTFIKQRQAEGIAAAKMRGVKFGRKKMPRPPQFNNLQQSWQRGDISTRAAARALGVTHNTFLRWTRE